MSSGDQEAHRMQRDIRRDLDHDRQLLSDAVGPSLLQPSNRGFVANTIAKIETNLKAAETPHKNERGLDGIQNAILELEDVLTVTENNLYGLLEQLNSELRPDMSGALTEQTMPANRIAKLILRIKAATEHSKDINTWVSLVKYEILGD